MMRGSDGLFTFKCKLLRVRLKDGSEWKPADDKPVTFEARVQRR